MRIAVAFDCFFPLTTGGGERLYRTFAETFADQGHEVRYLTRRQWNTMAPEVEGVDVVAVSGSSELYDDDGNRRPLGALRFAAGLFNHLVRHRGHYDAVLVSALPVLNVFAARLALLGSRTKLCSDFLEVWRRAQWLEYSGPVVGRVAAVLQHWAVRISPLISTHAQMNAARLRADGARSEPIVSPGLIDRSDASGTFAPATSPPTVVFVGRHIPDKRVDVIPAAIAFARTELPELRATIFGDGQQRAAVLEAVRDLGLDDVVDLPGFVAQDVLDEALRSAACLVNPSRREGYGLVVVEACAFGTPVVLVDAPDNASVELVEQGVNGFVAASTKPAVLGAALVSAVMAGDELRLSTRAWFERAATERTAERAALAILARIGAPARQALGSSERT